jgi:hypothetical protein
MRKRKLVKPRLQLKLILTFLSMGVLAAILQAALMGNALAEPVTPGSAEAVISEGLYQLVWANLFTTLAALVPVSLIIGTIVTFRLAGPIYRFESFLRGVLAGTHPEPCRLRKGDEMLELRDLLNEVTAERRAAQAESVQPERSAA